MKILNEIGWNLRRYAQASMRQTAAAQGGEYLNSAFVHPIAVSDRTPTNMIAQRIAALIDNASPWAMEALVEEVAGELYREELDCGAAVLDIGVFGRRLFYPEVIAALRAGDGVYWQIRMQRAA